MHPVDRNGRVRAFDYDQNGRLVREIWYNSVADADLDGDRQNTIAWTYDESGNLLSVVDEFSSYNYAYDLEFCKLHPGLGKTGENW